jgi:aryl-alcohol dehydrogenase-like predicted oxidoreductase/histidinol phosphatase-like enzyme
MRLSHESVGEEHAIEVIVAALDAGVRVLDTADVYAPDDESLHHNERLVRRALDASRGDRASVTVATKGGLLRTGPRWTPDGRAKHLRAACEASAEVLGAPIDLYYLHAPDPRTPLATSVRAIDALRRDGLVRRIGLSNVTAAQLAEAESIAVIDAVQVELGPLRDDALRNGVARWCSERGVPLYAHTPLGGKKRARKLAKLPALREVADRHDATPFEVAIAWLVDLDACVVPVIGATRVESVRSSVRGATLGRALDEVDRSLLDAALPAGGRFRASPGAATRPSPDPRGGDVVIVMGMPGAGKSTYARALVERGYARLNRDLRGGRLDGLVEELNAMLAAGERRVVLDNTYPGRAARDRVVEAASAHGVPARCVWVDTPIEQAQINAVLRMIERYGELLDPERVRREGRRDPSTFAPSAQFRWQRELEPPVEDEGLAGIERVPFERTWPQAHARRAVFVEVEDVLRRSRSGAPQPISLDDLEVIADRAGELQGAVADGALVVGISWQPGIAAGHLDAATAERLLERTRELLDVDMTFAWCPHPPGPPICWCRKPLPGLVLPFVVRHGIDPARSTLIGKSPSDRTLAARLGIPFTAA